MEKREPSYTVDENVSSCSRYGKQYGGQFLRKLKIELPYDPAIPFLGIYPDKTIIQKEIIILSEVSQKEKDKPRLMPFV